MKKIFFLILIFVLCSSLALAVSVETDKADYSGSEIVTINVLGCPSASILKVSNANIPPDLVSISEGLNDWQTIYNTASDPAAGKYMLFASCEDGTTATEYFCVDDDGCTGGELVGDDTTTTTTTTGSGGGCIPLWDCSEWSFCDAALMQSRICVDLRNCRADKEETQPCEFCDESWVCSAWSACKNGLQTKTCADEHSCGTDLSKPALQKSCPVLPVEKPKAVPPALKGPSFWQQYWAYLLGIPLALLGITGIIFLARYLIEKSRKPAINHPALVSWIRKEKEMGISDDVIRKTLENTSWNKDEVDLAFRKQLS